MIIAGVDYSIDRVDAYIVKFTERWAFGQWYGDSRCWEWVGPRNKEKYGSFSFGKGKIVSAHRFLYEYFIGPIPDDLTVDHICKNASCVNPRHLRLLTRSENSSNRKTHCIRGHEFTPENTIVLKNGYRNCRECRKLYTKEYRFKRASEEPTLSKYTNPSSKNSYLSRGLTLIERFRKMYDDSSDDLDDCWIWLGAVDSSGYGKFGVGNKKLTPAHRFSYEHFVGPIEDGLTLHHTCFTRRCVNPMHLVPMTIGDNTAESFDRTKCHRGHEMTPENTVINATHGGRGCRECTRLMSRTYVQRKHEQGFVREMKAIEMQNPPPSHVVPIIIKASEWGKASHYLASLCNQGRIPGASKFDSTSGPKWHLPKDTPKPVWMK